MTTDRHGLAAVRRALPTRVKAVARKQARRLINRDGLGSVHFLHIGKTGGTALKHALAEVDSTALGAMRLHSHGVTLWDIPVGDRVIFVVRDPVTRFCSAFWSRQRKGRPRYNKEWTADERSAYERFSTPNDLASALTATDSSTRSAAWAAMFAIGHVRSRLSDWLGSPDYLSSRAADILWIGRQESLGDDVELLSRLIDAKPSIQLPTDEILAHRNETGYDNYLTEEARKNLELWHSSDFRLIQACDVLRERALRINGA